MFKKELAERIRKEGVIAVVLLDRIEDAVPLCDALMEGGVNAIELTLRTPVAFDAAEEIKKSRPEMCLGLGTVLGRDQVSRATDVGVDFAVAPGCNPKIISYAQEKSLSFAPGIMTPTDVEMALELGCTDLKFFPAETSGGMKHLNSLAAPYLHLGLSFVPLGGVNISNAADYLKSPIISAVGGSWVAKRDLIQNRDWKAITDNAEAIHNLIKDLRS